MQLDLDLQQVMQDPLLFAESLLIEPLTEAPFRANYVQRQILSAIPRHKRIAVRVSRQTGKTYALTVVCLWAAITRSKRRILVIAPDKAKTDIIFKNIDLFLQANPAIAASLVRSSDASPHITREFSNGSAIYGFTAGSSSNRRANTIRGQGGDIIIVDEASFLREEDWVALEPIIQGGLYRSDALTIISSTPNPEVLQGMFYDIFNKPELASVWHRIHVPITKNPDFASLVDKYRAACPSELVWTTEYLAEFPDQASRSLMRRSQIEAAGRDYSYNLYMVANGPRAIGVDWDKYEAGVNIVVVRYDPSDMYYQVMYREEIAPNDMLLTQAVHRVLDIRDITGAEKIVVDRGYGEMQLEVLRAEMASRAMNAVQSVVGHSFSELVDFSTEHDAEPKRIRLKDAAFQWLGFLIERGRLIFPNTDEKLKMEMRGIQIHSVDTYGYRFRTVRDHIVAALSLALWELRHYAPFWSRRSQVPNSTVVLNLEKKKEKGDVGIRVIRASEDHEFTRSFAGRFSRRVW